MIYVKDKTIVILAVEVYFMDIGIDSHAESSFISFTDFISRDDRYYKGIKVVMNNQSEGRQLINKLVFGTTSLNILITSTFILTPRCNGTSTNGSATPSILNGCDLSYSQIN